MKATAAKKTDQRKLIMYITLAVIVIGGILAVGFASRVPQAATDAPKGPAAIKVGQKAPEFAVSTTGGPFDLATAQTPVFLEVFATWCPHCQREAKTLDALAAKYGKRISFVGVSGDVRGMDGTQAENQADVVAFAGKFNVTYPVAYDPDLKVANAYLQTGFPTFVIIKQDKTISYIDSGEITQDVLDKAIKAVL
jgi:cytochrome c biogenesis protein CcmG/thiol:disulfide interchange protein DsbE